VLPACIFSHAAHLQVVQTCFEGAGIPALYLANSAMISAFSMGRTNSLVIDLGCRGTKIAPVVDGYELRKSSVFTSRGGDVVDNLLADEIVRRSGSAIRPWFDCSKFSGKAAHVTPSFRAFHAGEVVQDVKQWMCFVPHAPITTPSEVHDSATISRLREEELSRRLLHFPPPYELPDGTLVHAGESICTVPERVFFPYPMGDGAATSQSAGNGLGSQSRKRTRELLDATFPEKGVAGDDAGAMVGNSSGAASYAGDTLMAKLGGRAEQESLADLVYACVAHADPDVRRELLGNIQLVGGGALVQGLSNRLTHELSAIVPSHMKVS
jgi:actin-like protein 6A